MGFGSLRRFGARARIALLVALLAAAVWGLGVPAQAERPERPDIKDFVPASPVRYGPSVFGAMEGEEEVCEIVREALTEAAGDAPLDGPLAAAPPHPEISEPAWERLDPAASLDLVIAYKRLLSARPDKPDAEHWARILAESPRVAEYYARSPATVFRRAAADVDHDGEAEQLYSLSGTFCEDSRTGKPLSSGCVDIKSYEVLPPDPSAIDWDGELPDNMDLHSGSPLSLIIDGRVYFLRHAHLTGWAGLGGLITEPRDSELWRHYGFALSVAGNMDPQRRGSNESTLCIFEPEGEWK